MTDAEKRKFLESEGWGKTTNAFELRNPVTHECHSIGISGLLDYCFRLACKRKSARERARLKRAGWLYEGRGIWTLERCLRYTKAEALKTLGEK